MSPKTIVEILGRYSKKYTKVQIAAAAYCITVVARGSGLKESEILKKDRHQNRVDARVKIYMLLNRLCGFRYLDIGKLFNRCHTTIIHAVRFGLDFYSINTKFNESLAAHTKTVLRKYPLETLKN